MLKKAILFYSMLFSLFAMGRTRKDLLNIATRFPVMPGEAQGIEQLTGQAAVVAAGAPYNDLEWTVFDTIY